MKAQELIDYIVNNHLEDYEVEVCHETGESSYPVCEIEVDHIFKTMELI